MDKIVFKNKALETEALTLARGGQKAPYERLEFLGDRVVGLVVADLLLEKYPTESEGDIAKRLTFLVQASSLASLAVDLGLDKLLMTDVPELRQNESILCDVFEAYVGAIYLDQGFDVCQKFLNKIFTPLMSERVPFEPKSFLQEWTMGRKMSLPKYTLIDKIGPDHSPTLTIELTVDTFPPIVCQASSKHKGEQECARQFIKKYLHSDKK